jgi:putative DNA primase/helicase
MMSGAHSWPDIESGFLDAMAAAGLMPSKSLTLAADGKIHRYTVEGDRSKSDNGWYVLFDGDIPAGAFGSWKTGQHETWHLQTDRTPSAEERADIKRRMAEAKKAREEETARVRAEAAERSASLWKQGRPASNGHPYLQAKRVKAYGLRVLGEQVMIPVRDGRGRLTSLQFIDPNGAKRFVTGGEMRGMYCAIGTPEGTLCIAEGYATAATILDATGWAVAIAFNAGNLLPVAELMRRKFPTLRIIICADNDQWTALKRDGQEVPNPGVTLATEAARKIGGEVAVPEFTAEQIAAFAAERGKNPTDFNDLLLISGPGAVRDGIAGERANVVGIDSARVRRDFEIAIEALEHPEEGEALAKVIRASELSEASKNRLYSLIAKQTKHRFTDLRRPSQLETAAEDGETHDDFIPELNQRHAVVPFGGQVSIMSLEHDPLLNRRIVRFYSQASFDLLYSNRLTRGFPISEAWLRSPARKSYSGVVFAPCADIDPAYFNLWNGWGVEPLAEGETASEICEFIDFLHVQIAGRSEEKFQYLLNWIAHLFQRPCELPEVALVLRSGEGTGKNTLVDTLAALVGQAHYVVLSNVGQVTGQFSGHLADALLLFANEAIWGGDKSAQGTLKAMITDPVLPMEKKGKDLVTMPNYKRMIFASNESWVVPRGMDDRRFAVFDVSEEYKQDDAYFGRVRAEMAEPGFLPTLMKYFMLRDISEWHPRRVPEVVKQAGWDMKYQSGDSVMQWWMSCLMNETFRPSRRARDDDDGASLATDWVDVISRPDLHYAYLAWCEAHKESRPKRDFLFGKEIKRYGIEPGPRSRENGRRPTYRVPPLDQARTLFEEAVGLPASIWTEGEDEPATSAPEHAGHA